MFNDIEKKVRLAKWIALGSFITSIILVIIGFSFSFAQIRNKDRHIYVIDRNRNIAFLATQTDILENRPVEYKAHIDLFHSLFFTLTADNDFIESQMKRAMYLVDETGVAQYNTLKESSFFNSIISSSAFLTIRADSIVLDYNTNHFIFYGKQRIERASNYVIRSLITEGYLQDVPRTENNPHGVLIRNWKTLTNKDLANVQKDNF